MIAAERIAKGLTKAQARDVLWFKHYGPAALFRLGEPSSVMRKRLRDAGLIEVMGRDLGHGAFGLSKFDLTDLGREVAAILEPKA